MTNDKKASPEESNSFLVSCESTDGHGHLEICREIISKLDGSTIAASNLDEAQSIAEQLLDKNIEDAMSNYLGPSGTEPTGIGGLIVSAEHKTQATR
jgi:hypothetical protein